MNNYIFIISKMFGYKEYNYILYLLLNHSIDSYIIINDYNWTIGMSWQINFNYYDLISVVFIDNHTHKYDFVTYDEIIKISNQ